MYHVGFGTFMIIRRVKTNEHNGTLAEDFIVSGQATDEWCRDGGGKMEVKLTR